MKKLLILVIVFCTRSLLNCMENQQLISNNVDVTFNDFKKLKKLEEDFVGTYIAPVSIYGDSNIIQADSSLNPISSLIHRYDVPEVRFSKLAKEHFQFCQNRVRGHDYITLIQALAKKDEYKRYVQESMYRVKNNLEDKKSELYQKADSNFVNYLGWGLFSTAFGIWGSGILAIALFDKGPKPAGIEIAGSLSVIAALYGFRRAYLTGHVKDGCDHLILTNAQIENCTQLDKTEKNNNNK